MGFIKENANTQDDTVLTPEQWDELARRIAADKDGAAVFSPWDEVLERLKRKYNLD